MPDVRTPPGFGMSSSGSALPPAIPDYDLLRRIGSGSYGEVWLARSLTGLYRAVKVVYRKTFEHDRPFERELSGIQKFEPISRTHASQVSILQVGRNQEAGYFYYVMELADDQSGVAASDDALGSGTSSPRFDPASYSPKTLKSEVAKRGRLAFNDCLEISLSLTTALDHLHRHGLIHRDIKPSNVIFVNGVPKLADIGLVTDVGATISYVGTEGFLPPEGPGTPQADIYSLGKVVYEISTGRDRMDFPELPTFLGEPGDKQSLFELNLIFLKACQNDVRKRYQSAREMYADVALLQSGKSLKRTRTLEERLANLTKAAVALASVLVLAALSYYLFNQHRLKKLREEVQTKEKATEIANTATRERNQQLVDLYAANGHQLAAQGDFFGALVWLTRALGQDVTEEPAGKTVRRQEIAGLLDRCPAVPALFTHKEKINSLALSPDGRRVVTASHDGTAQVWDALTGELAGPALKHPNQVLHASIDTDGQRVVTATADGVAQMWNAVTGEAMVSPFKAGGHISHVEFNPNGRQVLTLSEESAAMVWDASSGKLRFALKHTQPVLFAAFSGDGRYIATAGADYSAQCWNAATGEPVSPALAHEGPVNYLAFSPDGRRVITASGDQARVWNVTTGEPAHFIIKHNGRLNSVSFSPDGRQVITASDDMTARVWDAISGTAVLRPLHHPGGVRHAAFSPDGRSLLTVCEKQVQLWNATNAEAIPPWLIQNDRVVAAQFSPNDRWLLTASADGTARLYDFEPVKAWNAIRVWPAADLELLAQFLSGRWIKGEQLTPVPAETLGQAWQALRLKLRGFPTESVLAWHQQEAEQCEKAGCWFAALFHWDRALAADPKNAMLPERRNHAARELEKWERSGSPELPLRIPRRSESAGAALIDLSEFYNAALTGTWYPTNVIPFANDLSALPSGVQRFGGIDFDVRGIIQLSGSALENLGGQFPKQVKGIPVRQKCGRLHFLHGTSCWEALVGTQVGRYQINYSNGETRDIPLNFGGNIHNWWFFPPGQPHLIRGAEVAWEGSNPASRALGMKVRIFKMSRDNPLPGVEIESIDFISSQDKPAPFLIAVTVE